MVDANTLLVLQHLAASGMGNYQNIAEPLKAIFGETIPEGNPRHHGRQVSGFMDVLIEEKLIQVRDRNDHVLGTTTSAGTIIWFDFQAIGAAITKKGLEEVQLAKAKAEGTDLERSTLNANDSIIELNKVSLRFINFQKDWIKATCFVAGAAAIISLVSLFKNDTKTVVIERQKTDTLLQKPPINTDSLEQRIKALEDSLKNLKSASPPLAPTPVNQDTINKKAPPEK